MFGNNVSLSDIAAVTRNNDGMFGGDNGWWILIILFAIFGWGNGGYGAGGGAGAYDNYVLASDFATLQRQIDSSTGSIESKLDSVNNGICSLGYDQLGQMNGINTNILQSTNTLQAQLADCCCQNREAIAQVRYDMATQGCAINTNIATAARDITDNQNANTRAILEALQAQTIAAKDEKIADLTAKVQALNLTASQAAQNAYLINELKPCPQPAYVVPNPYCNCGNYNNF